MVLCSHRTRMGREASPSTQLEGSACRLGTPVTQQRAWVNHLLHLLVGLFSPNVKEGMEPVPRGSEVSGCIWTVGSVLDFVRMASA